MQTWNVLKFVRANGKCPFDKWYESKAVTIKDRAAVDARIHAIERQETLPPEWLKKYRKTDFYELKIRGDKKQLRPLCAVDKRKKIIILSGSVEKGGKIPVGDLGKAGNILNEYKRGIGDAKRYYED